LGRLFSLLLLRTEQLKGLSERAGSVRLTTLQRADDASQAAAVVAALAAPDEASLPLSHEHLRYVRLLAPPTTRRASPLIGALITIAPTRRAYAG